MIGGKNEVYKFCKPIFESFGIKEGYDLVGENGAGKTTFFNSTFTSLKKFFMSSCSTTPVPYRPASAA